MRDIAIEEPFAALPPLDSRRSLSDAVHHTLRDAITAGKLNPGIRLREVALASQLAVSPTPVREALRRLEREGLVDASSHKGATVASVSPTMMANLYELHETLEAFSVRKAAERAPHDMGRLWKLHDHIEASITLPDHTMFNRLDLQFHCALNTLSDNPEVVNLIEQTHRRIQAARARFDIHLPDRPKQSHQQHRQILEAVMSGDADEAEALARQHIRSVRNPVIRMLDQANQQ